MVERTLTPSKITAWLDCGAYLDLKHQVEEGLREKPPAGMSSFARLLADKGLSHEEACLQDYVDRGLRVRTVPDRLRGESFAAWVARIGDTFAGDDWDVLYQAPLMHDGIRGIADFLLRVVAPDGSVSVEPVDAKLARQEAKPAHVLQLSFYAEAIAAATGTRPERMHLWLGSGQVESLLTADFAAYWQRLRTRLARVLDVEVTTGTAVPEPCDHCAFCEFADVCDHTWRDADSLVYVAGLRSVDRVLLQEAAVSTLAALADHVDVVPGMPEQRQARIVTQARLQRQAREQGEGQSPPFLLIEAGDEPGRGNGLALLPEPDDGDVFLDFEGHPFWRPDVGLFFLLGLIECTARGAWQYRTWWAHDQAQEGEAVAELIAYLRERREQYPGMHVYHFNHTERSSLERLASQHGVGEVALEELVETGVFVDLLVLARSAVQVGTESYGLKALEQLTGYERGHDIDKGAGAVVEYERWMSTGAADALDAIAAYNEDDVRATRAVRDWLVEHRPPELPWRPAVLDPADDLPELDARVEQLHAAGLDTPEHLLGDVLGYWRREWKAYLAPRLATCTGDTADLLEDPSVLAGLEPVGLVERRRANGNPITPAMRFRFPPQECGGIETAVLFPVVDGPPAYASGSRLDADAGELDLVWSDALAERGVLPTVVAANEWISPKPKPAALSELADAVLDPAATPSPVAMALLRRDLPRFLPGRGPSRGVFTDDLDDMLAWTTALDGTCVAVQGPPGTGKTFRGARQIHALITAGKRVGITAFSHHAIDNLLEAVVEVFQERGEQDRLQAVKKVGKAGAGSLPNVTYVCSNKAAAKTGFNLVAGTTWLFSSSDMATQPVDVLVVDEAGQLSLADTLAACRSARNLLLLGDPLQLPQVAQASHPGTSGGSALQHLLGAAVTMPPDRGVFLTETRRMHPDVCTFISDNIYEGRLSSHINCAVQDTEFGTGLRWLRAEHEGHSTHAAEEVELVHAEIRRLLGTKWVNQHGEASPLTVRDFLVVAPYNDQVNLLRERLEADPLTRGVAVGSVDKFQGRQAAVVLFSMATSGAQHMPRGADFLFSRNRLNVAISRARCLAYLVCTEELLDSRGRDVEEMRLISTLCAFAASARRME
ncbi:TM0106 family RecB-like putative nuclease [Blastococcus capsensis]|uniref:TM0106 family RecB-like putative nuclease n=1 Tax=Blastococcus capsensis TaxID=1564163 RepID=UPI00254070F9|nr:TM0106 family RecB-like putative nuclease [Blastococcus capsensis]MDK3257000.1 TM0106 family RecB-like putative nuclease [Blastococcus capsensis]